VRRTSISSAPASAPHIEGRAMRGEWTLAGSMGWLAYIAPPWWPGTTQQRTALSRLQDPCCSAV
jgi:hypothetical protein